MHYRESFTSERLQILKQARQLAKEHTVTKSQNYKDQFDKSTFPHSYKVGDLVLYSKYNFLGKNKIFTPKLLGPTTIIDVNQTNTKIKRSNNKIKLFYVCNIKPFMLENAKHKLHHNPDANLFPKTDLNAPPPNNKILNNPPARPHTCLHTCSLMGL